MLSHPIVATGRGGSGTRLLSLLLQEHGLFLGNELNVSQDSIEWVDLIYDLAVEKLTATGQLQASWQQALIALAEDILVRGGRAHAQPWGWKLPETMLILPEVLEAFPGTRLIHLVRHPVDTCLRRTHMTSRMDNRIGKATLGAAYRRLGWDRDPVVDEDYLRNAASWVFQVEQVMRLGRKMDRGQYLEVTYETLCTDPQTVSDQVAAFLDRPPRPTELPQQIDRARQRLWAPDDERAEEVWSICQETALALGYRFPLEAQEETTS